MGRRREDRWAVLDKWVRDTALFLVGIAGVINELWFQSAPRWSALVFLASLLGLPFALSADERRRRTHDKE